VVAISRGLVAATIEGHARRYRTNPGSEVVTAIKGVARREGAHKGLLRHVLGFTRISQQVADETDDPSLIAPDKLAVRLIAFLARLAKAADKHVLFFVAKTRWWRRNHRVSSELSRVHVLVVVRTCPRLFFVTHVQ
jgi:hypothetical protein